MGLSGTAPGGRSTLSGAARRRGASGRDRSSLSDVGRRPSSAAAEFGACFFAAAAAPPFAGVAPPAPGFAALAAGGFELGSGSGCTLASGRGQAKSSALPVMLCSGSPFTSTRLAFGSGTAERCAPAPNSPSDPPAGIVSGTTGPATGRAGGAPGREAAGGGAPGRGQGAGPP